MIEGFDASGFINIKIGYFRTPCSNMRSGREGREKCLERDGRGMGEGFREGREYGLEGEGRRV